MGSDSETKFEDVSSWASFPKMESDTLEFWNTRGIFEKLRARNAGKTPFVFLEGPPTANGMPHVGHALGRALKDVYLRHKAMSGYDVIPWKGGWDCHGLPVEIEVEKELGLQSKKEIVEYGVDKFNRRCRKSVMKYEDIWKKMSQRLGFWIDMEDPYITMTTPYIESVWWSLSQLWKKDLLMKGHYVVPYCPRCGTPLSSHEVAQGYKTVKDPSVYIKFKVKGKEDTYFLVWTTTPWTLFSNLLLAVGRDIRYVMVEHESGNLILAKELLPAVAPDANIISEMDGEDLLEMEYEQLLPFIEAESRAFFVTEADFVSTEEGTGIVHIAPAFGVDDQELCRREGVKTVNPVDEKGCFTDVIEPFAGFFVKHADNKIIRYLDERGQLFGSGKVEHTYPFCWRCDSPLLYYALDSWFVRMSNLRRELMANNEKITWKPEHLKHGRFGKFLEEAKDWALSRNRFWGTPLPVWNCQCGNQICVGSLDELEKLAGRLPADFEPHRPWVDDLDVKCPECGAGMTREPYVIDTWYDSGSAPFAQFHYPFENTEMFDRAFPADFITEALDQTRGWFYTLLAVGTAVFDEAPYKKCLTQGLMLNDEGMKMSKSKGTALDPFEIYDEWGADSLRLALFSTPCWASSRFSDTALKEAKSKVMTTLWNVYVFFVNNANLDGFDPGDAVESHALLDRWIISRQNTLLGEMEDGMNALEVHRSVRAIFEFVDDLSNWYLRRSRRRFWSDGDPGDKLAANSTMYRVLCKTARMMAPYTPFLAESLYQNLMVGHDPDAEDSVHLDVFPKYDPALTDDALESEMSLIMGIAEAGRNARQTSGVRLRQPLARAYAETQQKISHQEEAIQILKDELNVKDMLMGPEAPVGDMQCSEGKGFRIYMDMNITRELKLEGVARDIVRRIQSLRKDMDLQYDQTVKMGIDGDAEVLEAFEEHREYITRETLAIEVVQGGIPDARAGEWKILGMKLHVWIAPI